MLANALTGMAAAKRPVMPMPANALTGMPAGANALTGASAPQNMLAPQSGNMLAGVRTSASPPRPPPPPLDQPGIDRNGVSSAIGEFKGSARSYNQRQAARSRSAGPSRTAAAGHGASAGCSSTPAGRWLADRITGPRRPGYGQSGGRAACPEQDDGR